MRRKLPEIIIALVLTAIICIAGSAIAQGPREAVKYLETHDGDTITVIIDGHMERVRLIGIDCPELDQEWGMEAGEFAARWCGTCPAMTLEMDKDRRDRYGRRLAYVWCERDEKGRVSDPPLQKSTMLNEALAIEGLAVLLEIPPNYAHRDKFRKALARAKKSRAGFWSQGGLEMSPRQWRKSRKQKQSAGF